MLWHFSWFITCTKLLAIICKYFSLSFSSSNIFRTKSSSKSNLQLNPGQLIAFDIRPPCWTVNKRYPVRQSLQYRWLQSSLLIWCAGNISKQIWHSKSLRTSQPTYFQVSFMSSVTRLPPSRIDSSNFKPSHLKSFKRIRVLLPVSWKCKHLIDWSQVTKYSSEAYFCNNVLNLLHFIFHQRVDLFCRENSVFSERSVVVVGEIEIMRNLWILRIFIATTAFRYDFIHYFAYNSQINNNV